MEVEKFEQVISGKKKIFLSDIKLNDYADADRALVQEAVCQAVKANPEAFVEAYKSHPEAHEGRYVAADLFKETFTDYNASDDSRNRYNGPVHNSAAVLSAGLFKQNLDEQKGSGKQVIFLTGMPGAGKTSIVLAGGDIPSHVAMIFEGQMSNPITSIEKIQQVIDAGLLPTIRVVHAKPEIALANTLTRFTEVGRGASINVMASIQGGLPSSLEEIRDKYGDAVELSIIDKRIPKEVSTFTGWQHVELLKSEGTYERIRTTLSLSLEFKRERGEVADPAYRQAAGLPPIARSKALFGKTACGDKADGKRLSVSGGTRSADVLKNEQRPDAEKLPRQW